MPSKTNILVVALIGFAAHASATNGGHDSPSELPQSCPTHCIQTVTTTVVSTVSYSTPTLPASNFHTYTPGGPYVNPNSTTVESSPVPYATAVVTSSASIPEHTPSSHSYPYYNSTVADPGLSSSIHNDSSSTYKSYQHHTYTYSADPAVNSTTTSAGSSTYFISDIIPTSSGASAVPTTKKSQDCHHNNCLRQFLRNPQVTGFCATYTTTLNTATTDLPDYVSQCHADPTRISSACSCVVTATLPLEQTYTVPSPSSTKPHSTKTAGGIFTYPANVGPTYNPAAPSTTEGCISSSVIFETYTTTTTFSVTVSAIEDPATTTDDCESTTEVETASEVTASSFVTSVY